MEVEDYLGNKFILKVEGVEKWQTDLFKIAKEIEKTLCFKVPKITLINNEFI